MNLVIDSIRSIIRIKKKNKKCMCECVYTLNYISRDTAKEGEIRLLSKTQASDLFH